MNGRSVTISRADVQAMYDDLVPQIRELRSLQHDKKVMGHLAKTHAAMPNIDWGSITGEICKDAPIVTKVIDFVDSIAMWIPIAGLGAALKIVHRLWAFFLASLLPQICPAA